MGKAGWTACVCAAGIALASLGAQPRLVPLGTGRVAFAVAGDEATGSFLLAGRSDIASPLARVWTVDESINVDEVLLSPIPSGASSVALGISHGSRYVAGYSGSVGASPFEATVWRTGQWGAPIPLGSLPGDSSSQALDVSDQGWVVGTSGGQHPFIASPSQTIEALPFAPGALAGGTFPNGRAEWISGDSTRIAGAMTRAAGNSQAVMWRGMSAPAQWLEDPFQLDSLAVGGSENGRNFAGDLLDGTDFVAAVWLDGVLTILEDQDGFPLVGRAEAVLDDRTVFGTGELSGATAAFIWNPIWGAGVRDLATYYLDSGGSALPDDLLGVPDAVADGQDYLLAVSSNDSDFFSRVPAIATSPWEVGGLSWVSVDGLIWRPQGDPAVYDVLAGSLTDLVEGGGDLTDGECLATAIRDPRFDDLDRDALLPGEGIWYLVRSQRNGEIGRWGGDYSGVSRATAPDCPMAGP